MMHVCCIRVVIIVVVLSGNDLATLLKESAQLDVNGIHLNNDQFGLRVFLMLQIRAKSSCTQHP